MADGSIRITIDLYDKYGLTEIAETLGEPNKGQSLAVIAIDEEAATKAPVEEKPTKAKRKWDEVRRSEQAAILCSDKEFQVWFADKSAHDDELDGPITEESTVEALYRFFGIKSRAEIDEDPTQDLTLWWDSTVDAFRKHQGQQRLEDQAAQQMR